MSAMKTVIAIGELLGSQHGIDSAKIICKPLFDELERDMAALRRYSEDNFELDESTGKLKLKDYEPPVSITIHTHGADIEVFKE